VLIELFSLGAMAGGRYEQILIGQRRFWGGGSVSAQFSRRRGCPLPIILHVRWDNERLTTMPWWFSHVETL